MDDEVDNFNVEDDQEKIFKAIKSFLQKNIDTDAEGNIKRTAKNLQQLQRIKMLRNILISDAYKAKVGKYIASFNEVRRLSDEYTTEL